MMPTNHLRDDRFVADVVVNPSCFSMVHRGALHHHGRVRGLAARVAYAIGDGQPAQHALLTILKQDAVARARVKRPTPKSICAPRCGYPRPPMRRPTVHRDGRVSALHSLPQVGSTTLLRRQPVVPLLQSKHDRSGAGARCASAPISVSATSTAASSPAIRVAPGSRPPGDATGVPGDSERCNVERRRHVQRLGEGPVRPSRTRTHRRAPKRQPAFSPCARTPGAASSRHRSVGRAPVSHTAHVMDSLAAPAARSLLPDVPERSVTPRFQPRLGPLSAVPPFFCPGPRRG